MAEPEVEAAWRAELERIGETQRHDAPKSGELKREAAFRWSGDEAQARRVQEEQSHHYLISEVDLLRRRRCRDRRSDR
jgi:hypothetical protein